MPSPAAPRPSRPGEPGKQTLGRDDTSLNCSELLRTEARPSSRTSVRKQSSVTPASTCWAKVLISSHRKLLRSKAVVVSVGSFASFSPAASALKPELIRNIVN
jgi:hypothetical protein